MILVPLHQRPEDIVGIFEIAERVGISKSCCANHRVRYADFPEAVASLSMGRIYDWREVRVWYIRRGLLSWQPEA